MYLHLLICIILLQFLWHYLKLQGYLDFSSLLLTELDFEIPTNEFLNKIGMTNIDNENHYGLFNVIEKETGVTYSMRFDFKVLSTYASGDWVVISEKGSDTKLSYIRRARVDNQVVYSLTEDVYLTANGEDIVGRPLGMVRSEGSINIGLLGTMTIFTTDNVYEVNNESFRFGKWFNRKYQFNSDRPA